MNFKRFEAEEKISEKVLGVLPEGVKASYFKPEVEHLATVMECIMKDNCGDFEWRDKLSAEDKKRIKDMDLYIESIDASVDCEYPYKNINSELNGLLGELMKENDITTGDSAYDYEWDRLVRSIYKKARKCDEEGQY